MTEQYTLDFSSEKADKFKVEPITWRHSLADSDLFTDQALIWLIDNHPRDYADFCTMDDRVNDMASWRGGDPGDHSGAELLQAVRQGHLWINLRKACNKHPKYQSVLRQMAEQLQAKMPGFKPKTMMGGILISSPTAGVPYHFDRSDVMLWHVRGRKRVWVYPVIDATLPEYEVEEVLLHDHNDDVPYMAQMDDHALIIDMEPGMVATWPLHAPHRVINQGDLNVSVTVEWSSMATIIQNGAQITNGILRRKYARNPQIAAQGPINRLIRFMASRVLRKMKLVAAKSPQVAGYRFKIDPANARGVKELDEDSKTAA